MNTSTVIELEEHISYLQLEIANNQKSLRESDKEVKRWTDKLETALSILKLNKNNKSFIKSKAEAAKVVDLVEFQKIKEKIEDLEDEVTECNSQLSVLNKTRATLNSSLNLNNTLLHNSEIKLQTYCKVIPLNGKK